MNHPSPTDLGDVTLKAIVLGCGLMGSVIARDLSRCVSVDAVSVLDTSVENLKRVSDLPKVKPIVGDVRDSDFIMRVVREFDIAVGALPLAIDEQAVQAVAKAGVSVVDLIFDWHNDRSEIDLMAKKNGVTIIPACGVAPELINILTMHAVDSLDRTDEIHIKVGGLP